MLNVLVAEDNLPLSVHLSNAINSKNVRCIGILNEGSKVYQTVKELNADVLILDMKLPGKDGIDILEEIQLDKELDIWIIVYSGEPEYIKLARKYGFVKRYLNKNTTAEEIGRMLDEMYEDVTNIKKEHEISEMLLDIGFSYNLKGTKLINDCILYSIVENEDNIKKIYDYISKRERKNVYTIKSDINTAIKNMWRFTDRENARKFLRLGTSDRPSCKGIISMVKYHIEQ